MLGSINTPLVDVAWVDQHLDDPDVRLIDIRWYADGRDARAEYLKGHIPGAVFVDLNKVTAKEGPGRHPIPSSELFEAAMQRAGVNASSKVVVYDDASGSIAARLWFLFRYFGHAGVAILDGCLGVYAGQLETSDVTAPRGNFVASRPSADVATFDDISGSSGDRLLLDARAPERYRGEVEPIDRIAGHIPGAKNAPWSGNIDETGRFKSASDLRDRFDVLGASSAGEIVVYCGSGVTACHNLLALEIAGFTNVKLYEGSWSDYSSRPKAAIATGGE